MLQGAQQTHDAAPTRFPVVNDEETSGRCTTHSFPRRLQLGSVWVLHRVFAGNCQRVATDSATDSQHFMMFRGDTWPPARAAASDVIKPFLGEVEGVVRAAHESLLNKLLFEFPLWESRACDSAVKNPDEWCCLLTSTPDSKGVPLTVVHIGCLMSRSVRRSMACREGPLLCDGRQNLVVSDHTAPPQQGSGKRGWGALTKVRQFAFRTVSQRQYIADENDLNLPETVAVANVCRLDESPYRLLKAAGRGDVEEFIKLYNADPCLLCIQDPRGQTALHVVARKGYCSIVNFIVEQNRNLDTMDNEGDTALHCAVRNTHISVIEVLLDGGANPNILNAKRMAPLHVACEMGNIDALEAMLKKNVDTSVRGEMGASPLHYCCVHDNAECARLLLKYGAMPCQKCDIGYFPIHIAAKCASANTLEVLIQETMKKGYDRSRVMAFKDKENNMPLHAAVNGGNLKAVEVCLRAGALVDSQQDDKSTPLHLAAAQGNLDMIGLMFQLQTANFSSALRTFDAMKMTPLHRAALFNHLQVVEFLIRNGADINSTDCTSSTPLLLAASKGSWDSVLCLIQRGADVNAQDQNSRNFLHLAIRFGGKLHQFGYSFTEGIKNLLDEKDKFGCTPLHYASKEGHLSALDDLIKFGAALSPKNNDKQSPFHFAARFGRYNTCRRLLESHQGPSIINETDVDGLSGLHIAAQNGHTKILSLLLQKGAVIHRDNDDNTPLHYASAQGWTHCMRIVLDVNTNLLHVPNKDGDTALHLAAKNGRVSAVRLLLTLGSGVKKNKEEKTFFDYVIESKESEVATIVVQHDRWEEILLADSSQYGCPFLGLIEHMPSICVLVLDRCQTFSAHDKRSLNYNIEFNFKFIGSSTEYIQQTRSNENAQPLWPLNAMVCHGRVDCLSHPVCVSFLKLKWNTYGLWVYLLILGLYSVFLACLTYFVVSNNSLQHKDNDKPDNCTYTLVSDDLKAGSANSFCLWVATMYCVLSMVKEVVQMITQKRRYFAEKQNALEWVLYTTSLVFTVPFLFNRSYHWQWEAGALAVFFAWFNLLVILQRFDFMGIYVVMFLEILSTLLRALCVFSVLIVAFGLSFFILLSREPTRAYSSPGLSLMRTAMMMLEIDYMASFNEPYTDDDVSTLHFGSVTMLMVVIFVLFMPILLINLLIGLAVGDIESVQKNARLKRLAGQVALHTDMERKMPLWLLARFDQPVYKFFPNKCQNKIANLWSRVSGSDLEDQAESIKYVPSHEIKEELHKQKQKLRDLSALLEKNNQLLRLILQKMEIHTEDEVWDEGQSLTRTTEPDNRLCTAIRKRTFLEHQLHA